MAIVLTKKKAVLAVKPVFETSTPSDIVELIEAVGALQDEAEATAKQIKALQAKLKPYSERAKALAELVSLHAEQNLGLDPDAEFIEHTEDFVLQVGKRGSERRVVDVKLAMKRMGQKVFFEKVSLGLGVIDQYLTPEEKAGVVETARVVRSIKVLRRAQGQQAA